MERRDTLCVSISHKMTNMKNYTWKHAIILHIYKLWTIHLLFLKHLITPFTTSCVIECSRSNLKVSTQKIHTSGKREREREDIQLQQGHLWAPFRGQCSLWLGPQAHHNNHVLEFLLSFPYEWSVILHKNIKNSSKLKDIREPKQNYYTF